MTAKKKPLRMARRCFEEVVRRKLPAFATVEAPLPPGSTMWRCPAGGAALFLLFQASSKRPEFTVEIGATLDGTAPSAFEDRQDRFSTRLGFLFTGRDYWWSLAPDPPSTKEEMDALLDQLPPDVRQVLLLAHGIGAAELDSQLAEAPDDVRANLESLMAQAVLESFGQSLAEEAMRIEPAHATEARAREQAEHAVHVVLTKGVPRWREFLVANGLDDPLPAVDESHS